MVPVVVLSVTYSNVYVYKPWRALPVKVNWESVRLSSFVSMFLLKYKYWMKVKPSSSYSESGLVISIFLPLLILIPFKVTVSLISPTIVSSALRGSSNLTSKASVSSEREESNIIILLLL